MNRKLISSGSEFESKIGYSRAVVDGDYVFVSGTTGYDYQTMRISGSAMHLCTYQESGFEAAAGAGTIRAPRDRG